LETQKKDTEKLKYEFLHFLSN